MASIRSTLSYHYRMKTNAKSDLKKQLSYGNHGKLSEMIPPRTMKKNHHIQAESLSERPVYYMNFQSATDKPCVLYLHGGAFLTGLTKRHWKLLDSILWGTGCPIVVPDYPLIPEHTHKKITSYCMEVYSSLIPKCPRGIILMGDSAGGNLALVLAQQAVKLGLPLPKQILLLSPFLDATGSNPVKNVLAPRDPVLEPDGGREAALLYAGTTPLENPVISPIFGSMKGLPKITVWTGSNDMLYADALLLKEALHQAKVPYHIYTYPHMVHDWMLDCFPESRTAVRQIAMTITESLR
ncbi:alpha/beta hydrolase fold domain-containing protein [Qiania dongpingensis]|uniref:Alpha/beta hydrolase n=1 Tax=Qiania dongpingensis TaxID=2763669 RepID=A0A7G9G6M4_9FIRM|nr:alpha/beta hydrolase [Qiania dongpingensis]QNM06456.1 alpha/beta hydrolase [Qiania dongpingensis]